MELRRLKMEDASLMLEWMHDESVVKDLKADFLSKTLHDCEKFIQDSWTDKFNLHFGIDDCGQYMGTVSLKNIENGKAEFAITIRACAMGRGIARWAMQEIIKCGFENLHIRCIYWYVAPTNIRAVRFYDKNGYERTGDFAEYDREGKYIWYAVYGDR